VHVGANALVAALVAERDDLLPQFPCVGAAFAPAVVQVDISRCQLVKLLRPVRTETATPSSPASPLPWNSGVAEGHFNRIKMLKRQMFGRAGFALLRKRVLLS
jgi:hypothetical protein